jgi:hypothetical protein
MAKIHCDKEEALDAQIAKAIAAGELADRTEPRADRIAYDEAQDAIVIYLKRDVFIGILRRLIQGLDRATPDAWQDFWITANGVPLNS